MLATIFAFFDVSDMVKAGRMTVKEFRLRQRAHTMRRLEKEQEIYLQAYLNRLVKATDKKGKEYVYKTFEDFYDEVKRKKSVLGMEFAKPIHSDLITIAKRMQHYNKKGGY